MSRSLKDGVDGQAVMALCNKFFDCAEGVDHRVLLNALILSYVGAANVHRCCTAVALSALTEAAELIAEDAQDPQTNYPSTTVH